MKLDFVEICGFRGFRDKVRLEFGRGFTVISGRNGVGKSTLSDAIEYALTGEIAKYRVEKAAKESVRDYLWWRGDGIPRDHYVTVGFLAEDGSSFTVTRCRESAADKSDVEIEAALCFGTKPEQALQQLCRTSIIRDEWIAALSLDLSETERFELVRAALGSSEGLEYSTKARDVLTCAEANLAQAEKTYDEVRLQVNNVLAQVSEARNSVLNMGDIADAMATIDSETASQSDSLVARIASARARLSDGRMKLNGMGEAIFEGREIKALRAALDESSFQQTKLSARHAVEAAQKEYDTAQQVVEMARQRFQIEEQADALASSLSALAQHGSKVGLHHGHCPLCTAARTEEEFAEGVALARARIQQLGSGITAARQTLDDAQITASELAQKLTEAKARLAEITSREEALLAREAAHIDLFFQYHLDPRFATDPDGLEQQLLVERERLIGLERAILTLEASQAIDRIADLEKRVSALRVEVEGAADRVSRAQAAVAKAKSIERSVRRASAEIIDERLAMISPLLNELYQRLRPHTGWRTMQYSVRGDLRRFLSLQVGDGLNPQFIFSSGQRRAAGLAFLLSVHLSRSWSRWKTLLLDDPVQHIDDFRALHLVEVLASLRQADRQIICAVEDSALAELLCRRLVSTADAPGRRYELEFSVNGTVFVARDSIVHPHVGGVLRQVSGARTAA